MDVAGEIELRPGEIGELIISGWHVNTYQVLLMQLAVLFRVVTPTYTVLRAVIGLQSVTIQKLPVIACPHSLIPRPDPPDPPGRVGPGNEANDHTAKLLVTA